MPQLATKLSPGTADAFLKPGHGSPSAVEKAETLRAILDNAHLVLRPLHRRASDAELRSYFVADLPTGTSPEQVEGLTRELVTVAESVYFKPDDDLPAGPG